MNTMIGRPLSSEYSVKLGFSFNIVLARNLLLLRNAVINQDFDAAIIVDGKEGSGKSVLAQQVALFLDIDNHIDLDTQICFTPLQFKTAVGSLKKGKAIIWDEARRGLNRRRFGNEVNLSITDMLAECRQHNLFLVIVMPSFYDMDLNVAIHRTRALIHVYYKMNTERKETPLERGFFRFYNEDGKNELYANKFYRQRYKYPHLPNHSFDASFVNHYTVDEMAYRERKRTAETDFRKAPDAPAVKQSTEPNWRYVVGNLMLFLSKDPGWLKKGGVKAAAEFLGFGPNIFAQWREEAIRKSSVSEPVYTLPPKEPKYTHKDTGVE